MALRTATERMTLDVSRLEVQTSLAVTQGDTARRWEIKLTDRGQAIEIGKRWTAVLAGIKPDNTVLYNGCTVEGGRIVYDFAAGSEIATAAGAYEVTLEVYDEEGEILHAPKIWLNVVPNRNRSIASGDQFTAAQEVIRRINEAEENIDEIHEVNERQGEDIQESQGKIADLEEKTITVQKVTVAQSLWADGNDTVNVILQKPGNASNAFLIPANSETRKQLVVCQIEVEDERETEDGWIISLSRGEEVPETDLVFVVYVLRGDTEEAVDSTVVLVASDGGEANIRIADNLETDLGYIALSARMGKKLNEEKAPAGFGLGGSSVLSSDVNTSVENGFYYTTSATANKPFDQVGWFITSNRVVSDCVMQFYFVYEGNNSIILVRKKNYSGVWGEWEYVNPPMTVGVEYRTTERWNGKPVYTKLIDGGALPSAGKVKEVGISVSNLYQVIDIRGAMSTGDNLPYINYSSSATPVSQINLSCTKSNLKLATVAWGQSDKAVEDITALVQVKYAKN